MEQKQFSTNLKCAGCIEKVKPYLDSAVGKDKWEVDLNDPLKVLTVSGTCDDKAAEEALQKAGYHAVKI